MKLKSRFVIVWTGLMVAVTGFAVYINSVIIATGLILGLLGTTLFFMSEANFYSELYHGLFIEKIRGHK